MITNATVASSAMPSPPAPSGEGIVPIRIAGTTTLSLPGS